MAGHQDIVQIDEDQSETGTTMSISHQKVWPALLRPKGILRNSNSLKGGYDCYLLYVPRPEERVFGICFFISSLVNSLHSWGLAPRLSIRHRVLVLPCDEVKAPLVSA
jgi:hypothetical protein